MLIRSVAFGARWCAFLLFLALTSYWFFRGHSLVARAIDTVSPSAEGLVEAMVQKLQAEDPQAAAAITRLREDRELAMATNVALLDAYRRGDLSGVKHMIDRELPGQRLPYQIRLASLATDANLLASADEREEFLWAHGTTLQLLNDDPSGQAVDEYFELLRHAAANPEQWRLVRNNATALMVADRLTAKPLRVYYEQEQDWLDDLLTHSLCAADLDDAQKSDVLGQMVKVAYDYRPYVKEAVVQYQLGAMVFPLFREYGEEIKRTVSGGVPLEEVLDVTYGNEDFIQSLRTEKLQSPSQIAARLVSIRNRKPSVWQAARQSVLALRLNEDVPQHADELFENFGPDGVTGLVYSMYEQEVVYAATAIVIYGDLAMYILTKYADSEAFRAALVRPNFGPRLIPYMAKFGDQGLDRLEINQKWLDKYFELDGTAKDPEWWTQIPGGAAAGIAKNWCNGIPNEWSEMGWAALDVADAALLVASFGGSAVVTTGGKQVGKTAAKQLVFKNGRERVIRELGAPGLRKIGHQETASVLRRTVLAGSRFRRATMQGTKVVWSVVASSGRIVLAPAERVLEAAANLNRGWQTVSPKLRRTVYRSLLGVGLFVTLKERTLPMLRERAPRAAGAFVANLIKDASTALAAGMIEAINTLFGEIAPRWKAAASWSVWGLGLLVLGASAWGAYPLHIRRMQYV